MRPLATLIMILGAIAALIFAFVSILDDGPRGGTASEDDLVVRPAEEPEPTPADLAEPAPVGPAAEIEVRAAVEPEGGGGAYEGFIEGTVVDASAAPVAGAVVSLLRRPGAQGEFSEAIRLLNEQPPPRARQRATTDEAGRFAFRALEPGNDWQLVVTHEKFLRATVGPIVIAERGGHEELVMLEQGMAFFGKVLDAESGQGIEGALLVLDNPLAAFLPETRQSADRQQATTDAQGRFGFRNVGGATRTLVVSAPGYATQVHHNFSNLVAQSAEQTPVIVGWKGDDKPATRREGKEAPFEKNFELARAKSIAGRVLAPNREGVEGVLVTAVQQSGAVGSRGEATTKAGGEFLIENVADGLYTVRAEVPSFLSMPLQRVQAGRTDVEIVLAELGEVAGRVVDAETGRAMSSFTARVRTHNPRNVAWGNVVAKGRFQDSKNGAFTLGGVAEGEYVVEAFAKGYASTFSEPFDVAQGLTTRNVEVRLTKGGTLRGTVVDSYTGEPLEGAEVRTEENNHVESELLALLDSMGSSATTKRSVRTDAEGKFELSLMTPDEYQVQIRMTGYTTMIQNNVKLGDGVVTQMGVQALSKGATIRGIVYGPEGERSPGARVLMSPVDNNVWNNLQGRSDANGRFVLKNAKPGTYKLSASRDPGARGNPFEPIIDMRNSEQEITVADGGVYDFELYLAPRN